MKNDIKLQYKNHSQIIKKKTYNRLLKQNIIKSNYDIDLIIWCLLFRYKSLGYWGGIFGSIQPKYYNYFKKENNMEVEGFASFLNHTLDYYFGLFYDLEKYFGCLGNFYNAIFIKGIYLINPPYIIKHINKAIDNSVDNIDKEKVSFLFSLPVWDVGTRKNLNYICDGKKKITDFKTEIKISKLKNNKYLKFSNIYCKSDFKYYDYLNEIFINYANTNILFLSNESKKYNFNILPKPSI
uniref:PCIF1 WW domain-containing protein n=1 Tax=viral metagenome TaxID=1070528 RepID=A0A6C0CYR2_9ZZZZ